MPSLKIVKAVCISKCKDTTEKDKTRVITQSEYLAVKRRQHDTFGKTANERFFFIRAVYHSFDPFHDHGSFDKYNQALKFVKRIALANVKVLVWSAYNHSRPFRGF